VKAGTGELENQPSLRQGLGPGPGQTDQLTDPKEAQVGDPKGFEICSYRLQETHLNH
jgi:hypothetical protein